MGDDERAVLAANESFYDLFAKGDLAGLAELWAERDGVAVLHPGWPPVYGRGPVLESWRRIIEGPSPPAVSCGEARAFLLGDAGAFVICREHLDGGDLIATNLFVREAEEWRLVHHQAGPVPALAELPSNGVVH